MRWSQLSASICLLAVLAGCKAPESPTYKTELKILRPWDNQENGKPIYTSLDTPLSLSYILADNALVGAQSIYTGRARFKLFLNGVDITDKQRKAMCGSEQFAGGYEAAAPSSLDA